MFLGFPCGSAGKESNCEAGDLGSIPGLGISPEEGKGYPLQYYGLENSMDCIVCGVAKSQTWLSNFHFHSVKYISCFIYLLFFILQKIFGCLSTVCQALSRLLGCRSGSGVVSALMGDYVIYENISSQSLFLYQILPFTEVPINTVKTVCINTWLWQNCTACYT